jgi:Peptidase_C39 like family
MAYDELQSNVEEVGRAAANAAAVYLKGTGDMGPEVSARAFSSSIDGRWLLSDGKLEAVLNRGLSSGELSRHPPEEIYDGNDNLLFRDFLLPLDSDHELRIRTGANKALGVLIVALSIGQPLQRARLVSRAIEKAAQLRLGPPAQPERVICYAYPRLGIILVGKGNGPVVMDLLDHHVQPVEPSGHDEEPWGYWQPLNGLPAESANAAASNFDLEKRALENVASQNEATSTARGPSNAAAAAARIKKAAGTLGEMNARCAENTSPAPRTLMPTAALDRQIPLQLIVQESNNFCAPASSQMILNHHGIDLDQRAIAQKMGDIRAIALEGTRPSEQVSGLNAICQGIGLVAEAIFSKDVQNNWDRAIPRVVDEITADRPVQRQLKMPLHVDVIAGLCGIPGSDDFMIRILDPCQPDGEERLDRWNMVKTNINDLILLHPPRS